MKGTGNERLESLRYVGILLIIVGGFMAMGSFVCHYGNFFRFIELTGGRTHACVNNLNPAALLSVFLLAAGLGLVLLVKTLKGELKKNDDD